MPRLASPTREVFLDASAQILGSGIVMDLRDFIEVGALYEYHVHNLEVITTQSSLELLAHRGIVLALSSYRGRTLCYEMSNSAETPDFTNAYRQVDNNINISISMRSDTLQRNRLKDESLTAEEARMPRFKKFHFA